MENIELTLVSAFLGLFVLLKLIKRKKNRPKEPFLSRQREIDLILGKVIPSKASEDYDKEIWLSMVLFSYRSGKQFEEAAKSPTGSINYGQYTVAPFSREHGLKAGENAEDLRRTILEEYELDLAEV